MTDPSAPIRASYKIRGPNTWVQARELYLGGWTAKRVGQALDVTEAAIRRRAAKEGWLKRDQPDPPPSIPPSAPPDLDADGAVRLAMAETIRLIREGRFGQAAEAVRLAEALGRLATRRDEASLPEIDPADSLEAVRRQVLALCEREAGA